MENNKISRANVKNTIQEISEEEKKFDQSLDEAKHLELEILKENNRHAKAMLGWLGQCFGHEHNAPINIAFISMLLGFALSAGCFFAAFKFPSEKDFWGENSERGLSIALASLTYIFGRNGGKDKSN